MSKSSCTRGFVHVHGMSVLDELPIYIRPFDECIQWIVGSKLLTDLTCRDLLVTQAQWMKREQKRLTSIRDRSEVQVSPPVSIHSLCRYAWVTNKSPQYITRNYIIDLTCSSVSVDCDRQGMNFRGITRKWVGAWGLMSSNATHCQEKKYLYGNLFTLV